MNEESLICTSIDQHIKSLIRSADIVWRVTLNDGTIALSDFNRPNIDIPPWIRLQTYCIESKKYPCKVECLIMGIDPLIMFEDSNGLDGVFVVRGASKDIAINDEGDTGIAYKHLVVGVLRPGTDIIDVKKFSWPENVLEPYEQTRRLTLDNLKMMIFKDEQRRTELISEHSHLQVS